MRRLLLFSLLILIVPALVLPSAAGADAREPSSGGGFEPASPGPHLTPSQRAFVQSQIEANRAALRASGVLAQPGAASEAQGAPAPLSLSWPLQAAAHVSDPGYHGVSGFVDHDSAFPGMLEDYECGTRTYDTTSGYNHSGVDLFLWPYLWKSMDDENVEIIAAAPGMILFKSDGAFDRSCSPNSNSWNAVYVTHADGSVAWYGHMKNGSVTAKSVGQSVALGEVLGLVGSSGNSTGPHLHFELRDPIGALADPSGGVCNSAGSLWLDQRPYYDSAINKIATQSAAAQLAFGCYAPELPNLQNVFVPGQPIVFSAFYRDQRSGQVSTYTVYRPDDSVFDTWTHASSFPLYPASYWEFSNTLPANAPLGSWRYEVVFEGVTTSHTFQLASTLEIPGLAPGAIFGLASLLLVVGVAVARRS